MEETQVIEATSDNYVISTIDLANPGVPPTQGQHDLLLPVLFQKPGVALQIGLGYGSLVYALEALGYAVHGIDTSLDRWFEARNQIAAKSMALVQEGDIRTHNVTVGRYDLIVADFCGAFKDPSMYDAKMFIRLKDMLNDTGIMAFNFGVVPALAMQAIRNADGVFPFVNVIPGTQVLIASKRLMDISPSEILVEEPKWLCSTFNLYGEADLP